MVNCDYHMFPATYLSTPSKTQIQSDASSKNSTGRRSFRNISSLGKEETVEPSLFEYEEGNKISFHSFNLTNSTYQDIFVTINQIENIRNPLRDIDAAHQSVFMEEFETNFFHYIDGMLTVRYISGYMSPIYLYC